MADTIKIVIIDDNDTFLRSASRYLQQYEQFQVLATFRGVPEDLKVLQELSPDVILLDHSMEDVNGLDAIVPIRAALPGTQVVMLTMHDYASYRRVAKQRGASGYVVKHGMIKTLVPTLHRVVGGEVA